MAWSWGNAATGGLGGAATGGAIGSFGGPIGTAIGAGVGGLTGLLSAGLSGGQNKPGSGKGFLGGSQEGFEQVPTMTPEQQSALMQLLSGGMGQLQNPYAGFEPIAQQAQTEFMQQTVPSLSERFTSLGGHGTAALSSPAFASQLGQAGAGLSGQLAALRAQYGMQNRGQALDQLRLGLQPSFENIHRPGTPGVFENVWNQVAPSIGDMASVYARNQGAAAATPATGNAQTQVDPAVLKKLLQNYAKGRR